MKIELTIPVLNEEQTIEERIETLIFYLSSDVMENKKVTIVIADNGSTDRTEYISKSLVDRFPSIIKYIKVDQRGVGLALKSSWENSQADIVGYMDLDLATDIHHIPEAISILERPNVDVVYGTRLHKNASVINRSLKREITSRVFNLILKFYFGSNISDGMCGFKFLKKKNLSKILMHGASSDGWFFCTEVLIVAEALGYELYELPVHWTDDNNSKVNIPNLALEYLRAMKKLKGGM